MFTSYTLLLLLFLPVALDESNLKPGIGISRVYLISKILCLLYILYILFYVVRNTICRRLLFS